MKKPTYKKYILLSILLIAVVSGIYFYREFNRKVADLTDAVPQEKIAAAAIVQLYDSAETAANTKFLGKLVEVTGPVAEINNQQDTLLNVLIGASDDMHKVSCMLDKKHSDEIKKYAPGNIISIKGICTGYLLDVELNRCVIVSPSKK